MIKIPFADHNDFSVESTLDGVTYFLNFSWNSEAELWTMAIQNANNEAILSGVALVPGVALIELFRTYAVPPGEFIVYLSMKDGAITRTSFLNDETMLFYVTEAEYATL